MTSKSSLVWTILMVLSISGAGCRGFVDEREYGHTFVVVSEGSDARSGDRTTYRDLLFSASPADFPVWDSWLESSASRDGMVSMGSIYPILVIEIAEFESYENDEVCLTGPMEFFDAVSLEQVFEIPPGTCLADGGHTNIVIEE